MQMGRCLANGLRPLHRRLLYHPIRRDRPKAETSWDHEIWLGKRTHSDEHYIRTPEGTIRARDVKQLPKSERYPVDFLKKLVGTPWQPRGPEMD